MTRDEVLERLDFAATGTEGLVFVNADLLRAAAELIRQSGWRAIAEAPENQWLFVGKQALKEWHSATMRKKWAVANGYTHYLPEPEPPALEDSKS